MLKRSKSFPSMVWVCIGRLTPSLETSAVKELFPLQTCSYRADCLLLIDGRTENERMSHSDTLLELTIFDEIRRQGGYSFPEGLEKVKGKV